MNVSPWKYFDLNELKCKCGQCGSTGLEMDNTFMKMIVSLREQLGFEFVVSSAYRCAKYNLQVAHTGENGPHTTGKAMDILIYGAQARVLIGGAIQAGFGGVGINQKGDMGGRFVHLDTLTAPDYPRPNVWSY